MRLLRILFLAASATLLLSACSNETHPKKNKNPKYFVTISGNILPALSKPIYLGFWAHYAAYSPKCKVWVNRTEGVKGMPAKTKFYPAIPNKQGSYVIKIPIDQYQKGRCNWMIEGIDYNVSLHKINSTYNASNGISDLIRFGEYPNDYPGLPVNKNFSATLNGEECIKKGLNNCSNLLSGAPSKQTVSRVKNYQFIQNIT
jgi:hypothetical protein